MLDNVPIHWTRSSLSHVAEDYQSGFASGNKDEKNGLYHLRMNNISNDGKLNLDLLRTVPRRLARPNHYLQKGDLLICTTNSAKLVGKSAIFDKDGAYAFSNHLTRIRVCNKLINNRFLFYYLFMLWQQGGFELLCKHWVNQSTIPKEKLFSIEIPLAPADEQIRIVNKIDALLAKVDACKERLDKIPAILKRFRQSVLSAACSGRLTEEWRAPHDVGDRDWKIVAFFDFCLLQRGYDLPLSNSVNGPYPIVTSAGEVAYHNQFKAHGPGVVTGRSGSIGKVYYVDKDFWPHNTALFVRDFRGNYPRYVYYFLLGFDTRQFSASTAVPTLNRNNLRDLEVNVPPIDEQHEIVRRVEALFKLADDIEKRYEKAKAHVDRLTQSILAKAFRGELVPQDPGDEPASELLKRIRQEKASKDEKGGVRSRRTRQD